MPTTTISEKTAASDASLRYGRIIGGAFLLEFLLVLILVPIQPLMSLSTWIAVVMVGVAVFSFGVSWLMFRRVPARRALHGCLMGVVATLIYVALCAAAPGGIPAAIAIYGAPLYWFGQLLRIGATTAGGMFRS